MKKHLVTALAVSVVAAVAATAVAQYQLPVLTFDARVTPKKAGTKKKRKHSKLRLSIALPKEARATTDQIVFNLPRHVRVSGRGFRYCPSTELDTTKDPGKCPKGSRVGRGTASAAFGPNLTPINFNLTLFAGSRDELGIWAQGTDLPIRKALRGVISRAGSPYFQKITIDIPPELQRQLGTYVYLTGLEATMGATRTARVRGKRRRYRFVSTVGCPADRKHRFEARVRFVPNPNPPVAGEVHKGATSACTGRP